MDLSQIWNSLKGILTFIKVHRLRSFLAIFLVVVITIIFGCAYVFVKGSDSSFKRLKAAFKWLGREEIRNKTGGKRSEEKKKSYWQIVIRGIGVILVLSFVLWGILTLLGYAILGKEETNPEVSVIDSSSSSSEGTEVSSGEPVEESSYVVVQADISWSDAEKACENDGGHLATITSREEYKQVVATLESYIQENGSSAENIFYVWLGGWNEDSDSKRGINNYEWITGEEWDHDEIDFFWCNTVSDNGTQISEPSFIDENTGDIENRLVLWKHEMSAPSEHKKVTLNWTFSDQNDDFLNLPDVSSIVKGRIAYICEYED